MDLWKRQENRYLQGNFAPVADEITATDLPVEGELPIALCGRYLRNGPNPVTARSSKRYHWFLGDGMVHGLRLKDGRAQWYRNRYVGSAQVAKALGRADIDGPNWNNNTHGPNTNVGGFAGRTWATVEAGGCPVELSYELESLRRNDFFGTLPGAFSAHPKFDPETRELHAMTYAWAEWRKHIQYVVVGADARVRRTLDIPLGMSMVHDMSLTGRFAIIYDQPVTVSLPLVLSGRFPFRWDPDHGNRVGLLPRDGKVEDIIWIDVPLGYAYHPMNAFDADDGGVVIDICVYERMFDQDRNGPFGDCLARLERWHLNPTLRQARIDVVDDRANEFPRFNEALTGRRYRFGYCVSPSADPSAAWPTVKHDFETGKHWTFDHGRGRAAGELVFVARADAKSEDDGWLLGFVHDLGRANTDFVVLDAADFARGYVARVTLPQRIPFGFHGNWVSDSSVAPQ